MSKFINNNKKLFLLALNEIKKEKRAKQRLELEARGITSHVRKIYRFMNTN